MAYSPVASFSIGKTAKEAYERSRADGNLADLSFAEPKYRIPGRWTKETGKRAIDKAAALGWGLKFESTCIDCGSVRGGHMYCFFGMSNAF